MKKLLVFFLAVVSLTVVSSIYAAETLPKPGKFDEEEIFLVEKLGTKYHSIVVQDYSTDEAELTNIDGEEKALLEKGKKDIVKALTASTVSSLNKAGKLKAVAGNATPKGTALILRGRFTKFNGGNGAAKYFLGILAPKGAKTNISIEAELVDSSTKKVLAKIKDVRSGGEGAAMGSGFMTHVFTIQATDEGEELADFIGKLM